MTSIVEIVAHYQKAIDKALQAPVPDEERLLHCIKKLYKLPISVQHLQETGIGRTVNALRKFDGECGVAAKALVTKWKCMVAAEESEDGDQNRTSNDSSENNNTEDDEQPNDESHTKPAERTVAVKTEKTDRQHDRHGSKSSSHSSSSSSKHHKSSSSSSSSGHHKSSTHPHSGEPLTIKQEKESSQKINVNHHRESGSVTEEVSSSDQNNRHHKSSSGSSSSSSKEVRVKKEKTDSDEDGKSSKYDKNRNYKEIKVEKESSHKDGKSKSSSSSSSSSHRHHHSSTSKSGDKKKTSDNEEKKSSDKSSRHRDRHDKKASKQSNEEKDRSQSGAVKRKADSSTEREQEVSSSSGSNSSSKTSKPSKAKEAENNDSDGMEFDQSEGFGFAEALGMLDMPTKKTKKSVSNLPTVAPATPVFAKPAPVEKKPKMDTKSLTATPQLLTSKAKIEAIPDVDIVSALPMSTISPNYRPLPLNPVVMDCVFSNNKPLKRPMTDDEALGASTSSRNHRTKIYSGVKAAVGVVPSLTELCYRVIQDHIELIEYTGGVPYYILKPILQKATADQLATFEHYNPYLMEESDALWEVHVSRRFRGKKREEFESWREMYFRCMDDQQARLEKLTKKVKHHQEVALPVKTTKLAYVDSAVKPPRGVASKQRQYGTQHVKVVSPAARVAATMGGIGTNVAKAGDFRLKVTSGVRDTAQAVSHFKPKKAPLMAKTLQALKAGRLFKR